MYEPAPSAHADIALIAAACGFDTIYVDMEHSLVTTDTAAVICTAALGAGITPFVRVPGYDVHLVTRILDGSALGIIFPHVETAEHASAMVATCRYTALGHRSVMGSGLALRYRAMPLGAN
jgi:2-keto-3-deoxy-L-rhamnonate aldolase RhmA